MRVCKTGLRSLSTEKLCQQLRVIARSCWSLRAQVNFFQTLVKVLIDITSQAKSGRSMLIFRVDKIFYCHSTIGCWWKCSKFCSCPYSSSCSQNPSPLRMAWLAPLLWVTSLVIVIITSSTISVIHLVYQYGDQNDCTKLTCLEERCQNYEHDEHHRCNQHNDQNKNDWTRLACLG